MTYREIFNTFPEPWRSEAIENFYYSVRIRNIMDEVHIGYKHLNEKQNALMGSFSWIDSPQGVEYWDSFYNTLNS